MDWNQMKQIYSSRMVRRYHLNQGPFFKIGKGVEFWMGEFKRSVSKPSTFPKQSRVTIFNNIGTEVIYDYKAVLQFLSYRRHISRGRIKNYSKIIVSKISA